MRRGSGSGYRDVGAVKAGGPEPDAVNYIAHRGSMETGADEEVARSVGYPALGVLFRRS